MVSPSSGEEATEESSSAGNRSRVPGEHAYAHEIERAHYSRDRGVHIHIRTYVRTYRARVRIISSEQLSDISQA